MTTTRPPYRLELALPMPDRGEAPRPAVIPRLNGVIGALEQGAPAFVAFTVAVRLPPVNPLRFVTVSVVVLVSL